MTTESQSPSSNTLKEQRILAMVKKTLTAVAKDTYTPPEMRHPLSEQTINSIRECLELITVRESELSEIDDQVSTSKPRFTDEPQDSVVVQFDTKSNKDK